MNHHRRDEQTDMRANIDNQFIDAAAAAAAGAQ